MTAYRNRDLAGSLGRLLKVMPVVVVSGMRQTGKSTMLRRDPAFAGRRYVSLDDLGALESARADPHGFVAGDTPMIIDEVQRFPELLIAIKREVDERRATGRFLLSGSANLRVLKSVTESLAGRAIYTDLHPFSLRELGRSRQRQPWLMRMLDRLEIQEGGTWAPVGAAEIVRGGMPMVSLGLTPDPNIWFTGFEQTYLERDVRDLREIADLIPFRRLLHLVALHTGQLMTMGGLARDAGLDARTVTRYLGIMEASFLLRRVGPFMSNRVSRLVKSPKAYLADSGLAAHFIGLDVESLDRNDALRGALLETLVAQNLHAILAASDLRAQIFFWNVHGRREVDFIVERGRDLLAIEVKHAARVTLTDFSNLTAFLAATPKCRAGILACNTPSVLRFDDRLWAIPLRLLLS